MGAATQAVRALTNGGSTTDAASFATASITGMVNELLVMAVSNSHAAAATLPTCTNWTQIATFTFGSFYRVTFFRRQSASVVTGAQTIDFGGTTQTGCRWGIFGYPQAVVDSANNGAAAIGQTGTNSSAAAALTINYAATVERTSAGLCAICRTDANTTFAARANWTSSVDNGHATPNMRFIMQRRQLLNTETAGGTGTSITGGGIVIEIKLNLGLIAQSETLWRKRASGIVRR